MQLLYTYSLYKFHLYKSVYCNLEFKGNKVDVWIYDKNPYLERTIVKETLPVNKTLQPIDYARSYLGKIIKVTNGLKDIFGF